MTAMPHYRPLRRLAADHLRPAKLDGRGAELVKLTAERLVVDQRYQRPITAAGRANIVRIVERFDWRKFSPVIVCRIDDGKYAIIDGQHRATAALMHPDVHEIPCMVIDATLAEAAECFAAINGAVTGMSRQQMWFARVTSGEQLAVEIDKMLTDVGVKVLRGNKGKASPYKPGETHAIGTIERLYKSRRDALVVALQAIVDAPGGNPGLLRGPIIDAMTQVAGSLTGLGCPASHVVAAVGELKLDDINMRGNVKSYEDRKPLVSALVDLIGEALAGGSEPAAATETAAKEMADA